MNNLSKQRDLCSSKALHKLAEVFNFKVEELKELCNACFNA